MKIKLIQAIIIILAISLCVAGTLLAVSGACNLKVIAGC